MVGGGVGGLAAAITLAARGVPVTLCEASARLGGLAAPLVAGGVRFDAGPYLLLDPVGLRWAFDALDLDIEALALRRVRDVYEVEADDAPPLPVYADLDETCSALDRALPGQGPRYRRFIAETTKIHAALAPLQLRPRPRAWSLVQAGALRHAPFLARSLGGVLRRAGLSEPVARAISIWTRIAGQDVDAAPSLLALAPAMIHGPGCFVPARGVAAVVEAVLARARDLGITLRTGARVAKILTDARRVTGVALTTGEQLPARAVISDASGVATLLELADTPARTRRRVAALPLQSPGVAAYLIAERPSQGPYLRFRCAQAEGATTCRLIVRPGALEGATPGPSPLRVVAPLDHAVAERLDAAGQGAALDRVLAEPWVQKNVDAAREVARLVPATWGRRVVLHRDSMNPTMTARFMRQGRLPHRITCPEGLFLVGSATHPGQWVSFCLISGVLGARALLETWGAAPAH